MRALLPATLLVLLSIPTAARALGDPIYEIGHISGTWPGPAGPVTAEVYYPALAAGEGVPVASVDGGHPLVVFGHGFLMPATVYGYLHEALTPRGFVVALPTTAGELFPDHAAFAQDLTALAEGLLADSATPGALFEAGLSGRVAAMGHSMGGGAGLLAAAGNPLFTAVAALAAAETDPSATAAAAAVTQPLLLLSGGDDCVTPPAQQQAMYAASPSACRAWITLDGASHCQFASTASACELGELFCSSSLSPGAQQNLVLSLLGPWLEGVLNLDPAGWAQFEAAVQAGAGLQSETSCFSSLTVLAIGGVDAAQSGGVAIQGVGLDFVVAAQIAGQPATVQAQSANGLVLAVDAGAPGLFDLDLTGLFGSVSAPGAVARYPALGVGSAQLGQALETDLFTGSAAAFALAWSPGPVPPLVLPGIDHGLELGPPIALLAAGVTDSLGIAAPSFDLPGDPAFEGVSFAVQGYAELAGAPSFTNGVVRTIAP